MGCLSRLEVICSLNLSLGQWMFRKHITISRITMVTRDTILKTFLNRSSKLLMGTRTTDKNRNNRTIILNICHSSCIILSNILINRCLSKDKLKLSLYSEQVWFKMDNSKPNTLHKNKTKQSSRLFNSRLKIYSLNSTSITLNFSMAYL